MLANTGAWFAAELAWLKKDLEENHAACTAAYWHQPTFSATNSITPEGIAAQAFWQLLYQYRADLVLNGHDHLYARYRPLDPSGNSDPKQGIREFIVGTGGETLDPIYATTVTSSTGAQPGYAKLTGETNQEDPTGNTSLQRSESRGVYRGLLGCDGTDARSERLPLGFRVGTGAGKSYRYIQWSYIVNPAPNTTSAYSDTGVGVCHGGQWGW